MAIEVAYGVPDSVPESTLLAALANVRDEFDENPAKMLAVLGPPGRGVRWIGFVSSTFGPNLAMAEDHFSDVLRPHIPELIVVARRYQSPPFRFASDDLVLERSGDRIAIARGTLAGRRDGAVDEIGLRALGLDAILPFAALDAATHQVALRVDHRRPDPLAIVAYGGELPSVGVQPRHGYVPANAETFSITEGEVGSGELAAHVEAAFVRAEAGWIRNFEVDLMPQAHALARPGAGAGVVPLLVAALAGKCKPRSARLASAALGLCADAAGSAVLIPYAAKPSAELSLAGYCGLAAHGAAARAALAAAAASKKGAERAVGQGLLPLIDAPEWAPLRAMRAARDAEPRAELIASARNCGFGYAARDHVRDAPGLAAYLRALADINLGSVIAVVLQHAGNVPDAAWAVALYLVETPLDWPLRHVVLRGCAEHADKELALVAELLARFPPFADDPVVTAIANGKTPPDFHAVLALHDKARAKKTR